MADPQTDAVPRAASSPWLGVNAPRRSVLADEVYEILKSKLMDNVVEPGSRLSIDGLARELKVSPTPIREALARLESDGLVAKRAHHGYTAAPLIDARTLDELFRMRLLLEPACASWAARDATARQITGIKDLLAEMRKPLSGDGYENYKAFAAQDAAFHLALAEATGVGLMVDALERLRPHAQRYRLYYTVGIADDTVPEHERVLDAVMRRDEVGAAQAMSAHLSASRHRLAIAVVRSIED
ncbi:DNA-binding GntR family transcriptional regulator [Streptacidiphilus sp. MAP12-16]|uniref:GntR family transcriptional regulator n=1 Tax=Streptacidiphilus sp. MAP12-16 TaxID=3156300 RepID=UPI003510E657